MGDGQEMVTGWSHASAADAEVSSDRRMTVHCLTEFVFCERAGVLAAETQSDFEPRETWDALRFSMPYSLQEVEQLLGRALNRVWLTLFLALLDVGGAGYSLFTNRHIVAAGCALALFALTVPARRLGNQIKTLLLVRDHASTRVGMTPSPESHPSVTVEWWELLADGWMSVVNHEPYRDDELGLSGTPWRVLRKGDLSIPVFKLVHANPDEMQIFPQHIVRVAAYCHLIETCEGRKPPFGILLFGRSYRGLVIANDHAAQRALREALANARQVLQRSVQGDEAVAAKRTHCERCPWGAPRIYSQGETEIKSLGEWVPVFGTATPNGKLLHSPCGDRFCWVPPHEYAERLGITQ